MSNPTPQPNGAPPEQGEAAFSNHRMTKTEATAQAIERIKGQPIAPGKIIASRLDPHTFALLRYEGEDVVCDDNHGGEVRFPAAEVFDVNKVVNVANHLLNLGFWTEGMESIVVKVSALTPCPRTLPGQSPITPAKVTRISMPAR